MKQEQVKVIELLGDDYFDAERDVFVINTGNAAMFPTEAKINDDGVIWDCYLWRVRYYPKRDIYTAEYKTY